MLTVFSFLALILSSAGWGHWLLQRNSGTIGAIAGILGLPFAALLLTFTPLPRAIYIIWLAAGIAALAKQKTWRWAAIKSHALLLVLLLAHLAIRSTTWLHLILPPYHDAPVHANLTRQFLQSGYLTALAEKKGYYHLGFHAISALVSQLEGRWEPLQMLILACTALVLTSIWLYGLLQAESISKNTAMLLAFIIPFLWQMPFYALNWSKFPALLAISFTPLWLWLYKLRPSRNVLLLSSAALVLLHTRQVFVLAAFFIADVLSLRLKKRSSARWLAIGSSLLMLIWLWKMPWLYRRFYADLSLPVFWLWSGLLYIASWQRPDSTIRWAGMLLLLMGLSSWQIPLLNRTPIDRPFFEMVIWLPAGMLLASGVEALNSIPWAKTTRGILVPLLGILAFINFWNGLKIQPFFNFVHPDDLATLQWLADNIPADGVVFVAARDYADMQLQTDAGSWVSYFLPGKSIRLNLETDFSHLPTMQRLCASYDHQYRHFYVYQGAGGESFYTYGNHPWLQIVFWQGHSYIWQLTCPPENAP